MLTLSMNNLRDIDVLSRYFISCRYEGKSLETKGRDDGRVGGRGYDPPTDPPITFFTSFAYAQSILTLSNLSQLYPYRSSGMRIQDSIGGCGTI